jgi:CRISPR-associated protein Cmr3
MTWIFIEPTDVWLFRDSRSFTAGEGHRAESVFPPTPFTVQGAIRSRILGSSSVDWAAFKEQSTEAAREMGQRIGYPGSEDLGQIDLAGPFLARRDANSNSNRVVRYVPLPADVMKVKGEQRYATLQPARDVSFDTNWPADDLVPLWSREGDELEMPRGRLWLAQTELQNYLDGQPFTPTASEDLFLVEPRIGIGIDHDLGRPDPEQSMLYQAGFVRPRENVGLLVHLDGQAMPADRGLLKLGGEARSASYTVLEDQDVEAGFGQQQPSSQLKLVFLTPAYFTGGWQPAGGDWSPFFGGTSVRLVAAALGRPQRIGGWDIVKGQPKIMRGYVPPGSVYYVELDTATSAPRGAVTETPPGELPMKQLGFGQIAVSSWSWL